MVDADIKGYFDSIPHNKLMEKIGKKLSDGRVLKLIQSYLKAGVMETGKGLSNPTTCSHTSSSR